MVRLGLTTSETDLNLDLFDSKSTVHNISFFSPGTQ